MAAKAIIITNTLAFILIGININRYGLLERTFPGHTAHHGVPNQLIEKSHDYKSLNFRKDTKPFSFAYP
jgi:hypothetical protein